MTTAITIQTLAQEVYDSFEQDKRSDGEEFWKLRDGRPQWMQDLMRECHGDMMPDDFRYAMIRDVMAEMSEADDLDDLMFEPDVYTSNLTAWLASHLGRVAYVNEALEQYGEQGAMKYIDQVIGMGQVMELEEIAGAARRFLEARIEEAEEE
jgi:hypothetical protein